MREQIEEVLKGLGYSLIELVIAKHKGSAQIKMVIYNGQGISSEDCSRAHRAVMPRLELAFPEQNVYLEVSSPGMNRLIKNRAEYAHYLGKTVRCYRTDISDWTAGVLKSAGEEEIELLTKEGIVSLNFGVISKARLE